MGDRHLVARPPRARILVVEDEPDIAVLVVHDLTERGHEVHSAVDGDDGLAKVLELRPELVVLDLMMPGPDGVEVCRRLRADPRTASIAIVMLTARCLTADLVDGLARGADDFVTKPFDPEELAARVEATLRRTRELRASSPLTGLPGGATITMRVDDLVRAGEPFALVHADLDAFKAYNDRYGFVRGDRAIRYTGDVLCTCAVALRVSGREPFVGHIGGDDFALVVPPDQVEAVAETVVDAFDLGVAALYDPLDAERGFIEVADRTGTVHRHPLLTLSLGIATSAVRPLGSSAEAAAVAVEMKGYAKAAPGSSWRIDRRRS